MMDKLPTAAIIGRPNVGKSSLFNRLIRRRMAIVDPTAGVTRDRIEEKVTWQGTTFRLLDTGGVDLDARDGIMQQVQRQVNMALQEADVLLFLVDAMEGPMPVDMEIMQKLRKLAKPLLLVANKADTDQARSAADAFYQFGFDKVYAVSALHGRGVGDFLDALIAILPPCSLVTAEKPLRVALLGKPNVGKSTFINAVLQEERMVVHDKPGTTRDAVDVQVELEGKTIVLMDTAGIRRRQKWEIAPDFYSSARAKSCVRRCDVVILMLDGTAGISQQDRKLAKLVEESGKEMVICLNKWDLVPDVDIAKYTKAFFTQIPFARYAPLIYTSALKGRKVHQCLEQAQHVHEQAGVTVPTSKLNKWMEAIKEKQPHPTVKGKPVKIFFLAQTGTHPITFTLFVNDKTKMNEGYLNFLRAQLRRVFGFEGAPIRFVFRNRRKEGTRP